MKTENWRIKCLVEFENRQHENDVDSIERIERLFGRGNYYDYYYWSNRIWLCVRLCRLLLSIVDCLNSTQTILQVDIRTSNDVYVFIHVKIDERLMLFDSLQYFATMAKITEATIDKAALSMEILNFTVFVYCDC